MMLASPSAPAALAAAAAVTCTYAVSLPGYHSITITNADSAVCAKVKAGLDQIKEKSPIDFAMIAGPAGQVQEIRVSNQNFAWGGNSYFELGLASINFSPNWCSSSIVHESVHLWYYKYANPAFGCDGEARTLERQALYLDRIGDAGLAKTFRDYKGNWDFDGLGACTRSQLPPTAEAGLDATVEATAGIATVKLDGFSSTDEFDRLPSMASNYLWTGPFGSVTGHTVNVSLPTGTHTVTLKVTDSTNKFDTDDLKITVTGSGSADTTPPGAINTLAATGTTHNSVTLRWTATGDDGNSGTAVSYNLRYSLSPITSANFAAATPVANPPLPAESGTVQNFTVAGLSASTAYYFAIKAIDEGLNSGPFGNVATATTSAPPPNVVPVANAGADATIVDTDGNGSQAVTLNGSASTDSDGTIATYVWKEGTAQIGTGVSPSVTLTQGQHTIVLTVTDDRGGTDTDSVVITVKNNEPPIASITNPADNATFLPNSKIDLKATASDPDGTVSRVDFFVNGVKKTSDSSTPYEYAWWSVPAGTYEIVATAVDNFGRAADSHPITIRVALDTGPTSPAAPRGLRIR